MRSFFEAYSKARSAKKSMRIFSFPPRRNVPRRPYPLDLAGSASCSGQPQREPLGAIDHFCVGVERFEPERAATLRRPLGSTQAYRWQPTSST